MKRLKRVVAALLAALIEGLAALRPMSVSEWADTYRVLPDSSAEPGPWRTGRAEYLREIQDVLSIDDPTEKVVVMKAAQLGFSEAMNNWIGYSIHQSPCTFMMVQPSEHTAISFSKMRVAPMIASCSAIRSLVFAAKGRDGGNTIQHKQFAGGSLTMVGAQSPAGLASRAIKRLACDEVDRFPASAGTEGDPVGLAEKRTTTFPDRKILLISTPVEKSTSRIAKAYAESDQRKYWVPCPMCGHRQVLLFERLVWSPGQTKEVRYRCSGCEQLIHEAEKVGMVRRGEWRAEHPEREGRGYWISALYSPWDGASWSKIAEQYKQAKGDPQRMLVFMNTMLGEPWDKAECDSIDPSWVLAMREPWSRTHDAPGIPPGVGVLTAGVDVQANRFEVTVLGWGRDDECWFIDHVIIPCDTTDFGNYHLLDCVLMSTYTHEWGYQVGLVAATIDTGGGHTGAVIKYLQACEQLRRPIFGVKGKEGWGRPIWPRVPSKLMSVVDLYPVAVDVAKMDLYARLRASYDAAKAHGGIVPRGRGMIHILESPRFGPEWADQLTAEKLVVKVSKHTHKRKLTWDCPPHKPNEGLDCAVYGRAAYEAWRAMGGQIEPILARMVDRRPSSQPSAPRRLPSNDWVGAPRDWLK